MSWQFVNNGVRLHFETKVSAANSLNLTRFTSWRLDLDCNMDTDVWIIIELIHIIDVSRKYETART